MATIADQNSSIAGEFSFDARQHGHPEGPDHVHVEINQFRRDMLMAIIAAGVDGRYSFDFIVGVSGIEIERAYIEGMREPIDALPDWVDSVREQVEVELAV